MFNRVKLWSKVTAFWIIDRTVKSTLVVNQAVLSLPGGSLKIMLTVPLRVNKSQNFCIVNLGIKGSSIDLTLCRSADKSNFSPISRDVHILQGHLSLRDQSWSLNLKVPTLNIIHLPWSCFLYLSSLVMVSFFIFLGHVSFINLPWLCFHSLSSLIMFPFFIFLDHVSFLYLPWSCFLYLSSLIMFLLFIFLDYVSYLYLPWSCLLC